MPEIHLKQPGFTYSACGPFTNNKERVKKNKETWDSRYIYQNELDKVCFQHSISSEDFKNLNRRRAAEEVLCDKAFNIAKNPTYDRNVKLLQWFINFYIKKIPGGRSKNENIFNEELTKELRKQIIRKLDRRKVYSSFIDNIWGADLADMQWTSKCNWFNGRI